MAGSTSSGEVVARRGSFSAAVLCLLFLLASLALLETRAAPLASSSNSAISDYDTVRELYELLMRRAAYEDVANRMPAGLMDSGALLDHELVRKSAPNRSPSLRLRFGRRADPLLAPSSAYSASHAEPSAENLDN